VPVDNLISANLVTARGELIEVSEHKNEDLLWAIKGAGPNFGIVTSLRMKVHPRENVKVWMAQLVFPGDKLEEFLNTMNDLKLSQKMIVNWGLTYVSPGPSSSIFAGLTYLDGDADAAEAAFQPLFNIGPDQTMLIGVMDYARMNDAVDAFCEDGGRKPTWLVGLKSLDYPTWQQVSDQLATFAKTTNQTDSRVLVETYSTDVLREIGSEGASYPHRDINFYAFVQPIYDDSNLDDAADKFGAQVRELWRETDGFDTPRT
jgi:FAD/FMN-containing dehydrogenase